jgi:spore coat protein H
MSPRPTDGQGGVAPRWRVVWLSLCLIASVADRNGSGSLAPASASDQPLEKQPLYRFKIELTPDHKASLERDSRRNVPAHLRIDGVYHGQAAIHLKGRSSFRPLTDKPSFTVDFARYQAQQRFQGLRKVHLNNSVEDESFLREWIGSDLFRSAGVPAPVVAHALVELNGRPLGLYVLREGFSEEFLSRHFTRSDGELLEPAGGQSAGAPMQRLLAAANEPDLNQRWERLQEVLDVERFLSFVAMEIVTCHWDGYALARNNCRVYYDPATAKMVFLPAGMDQLFANPTLTWRPQMAGAVARSLLEIPEAERRYRVRLEELVRECFDPKGLSSRVDQRLSALRSGLSSGAFAKMQEEAAHLCSQISQRYDHLRRELAEPELGVLSIPCGGMVLSEWRPFDSPAQGRMLEQPTAAEGAALRIVAGPATSASWRSVVRLAPGRYRFEALGRVQNVTPLPFGKHHGARLRVGGMDQESEPLLGTRDWQTLGLNFEVAEAESTLELICELRASAGEAWFAKDSLRLSREESVGKSRGRETQRAVGTKRALNQTVPGTDMQLSPDARPL